jgi:DUF4097 and DUF4098 domain-containing protein YvlB
MKNIKEHSMKNKYKLIIFIVLVVLMFFGMALIGAKGKISNLKYVIFGDQNHTLKTLTETNSFIKLKINIVDKNIEFITSEEEEIKIEYYESEQYSFSHYFSDDTLGFYGERNFYFNFNFFNFNKSKYRTVKVYLPKGYSGAIEAITSNSKISISDYTLTSLDLESSNGKITVSNINTEKLELTTSNSTISLSNINVVNDLYCQTSNGKVLLNNISAEDIEVITSNGAIEGSQFKATSISFNTSNSPINTTSIDCGDILAVTSNSKVTLGIIGKMSDYKISYETFNGNAKINDVNYANKNTLNNDAPKLLFIETSNAYIYVNFTE